MLRLFAALGLLMSLLNAELAHAADMGRLQPRHVRLYAYSVMPTGEAWVPQAPRRIAVSPTKSPPEAFTGKTKEQPTAKGAKAGGSAGAGSCTAENASSPNCYAATQQGRGK
jgi:hypothetical protein